MQVIQTNRRTPWWLFLISGALLTLAGVGLIAWPFIAASWVLALMFGTALISSGLAAVLHRRAPMPAKVIGIVLMILGSLAIIFNEFTASILVVIVGATFITLSLMWLITGIVLGAGASPLTFIPAILGLAAGLIPMIWPGFALSVIAVLFGIILLFWGIAIVASSFALRKRPNQVRTIVI